MKNHVAYYDALMNSLSCIFKKIGMSTAAFNGLNYEEYTLLEPDIDKEFSATARYVFNNWFFYGTKFTKLYNSASLETQETLLLEIIYYLMQCIINTSPFDCAYMLMEMGAKVKVKYKTRMLLSALDSAEKSVKPTI